MAGLCLQPFDFYRITGAGGVAVGLSVWFAASTIPAADMLTQRIKTGG
jgi:hypothetical protein